MTDFLSRLDSADPASVPGLCLLYADWLSERGEPCDGWMALGRLGRIPWYFNGHHYWFPNDYDSAPACLPIPWGLEVNRVREYRSLALAAAASAFEGLAEEVKREILGNTLEAVK